MKRLKDTIFAHGKQSHPLHPQKKKLQWVSWIWHCKLYWRIINFIWHIFTPFQSTSCGKHSFVTNYLLLWKVLSKEFQRHNFLTLFNFTPFSVEEMFAYRFILKFKLSFGLECKNSVMFTSSTFIAFKPVVFPYTSTFSAGSLYQDLQ